MPLWKKEAIWPTIFLSIFFRSKRKSFSMGWKRFFFVFHLFVCTDEFKVGKYFFWWFWRVHYAEWMGDLTTLLINNKWNENLSKIISIEIFRKTFSFQLPRINAFHFSWQTNNPQPFLKSKSSSRWDSRAVNNSKNKICFSNDWNVQRKNFEIFPGFNSIMIIIKEGFVISFNLLIAHRRYSFSSLLYST